jgi:hypothetical protein
LLLKGEQRCMATDTRAELAVFDCNLREGGLEEFEPEDQRGGAWLRVPTPTVADVPRWQPRVELPRARIWPFVVPVVIAAALVGLAVSWVSTEIPRVDPAAVAAGGPDRSAATGPDKSAAATAAAESVTPLPATPAAPPAPAVATVPTEPVRPPTNPAFEQTLAAVSRAYRALDAAAVAAVLPDTDPATLTQAFSELKYQSLSFDRCALRPNGAESAVASCEVSLAMAPKSGDAALQRRHEAWTLVLNRSGEAWRIAAVTRR